MGRIVNIITAVIIVLMLGALGFGIWLFLQPTEANDVAALPTVAQVPTITPLPPTSTPRPTLPPTFTPIPTITLSPTPTMTLTLVPSLTPTITDTPAITNTPLPTETAPPTETFTPSPTSNIPTATPTETRSPYPFTVRGGMAVFTQNTFNTQGCAFQGIAGQVLSLQGGGLDGILIYAIEPGGTERFTTSGFATAYGAGGYEIPVDTQINSRTYLVELRTSAGTPISERVQVTFPSNCDQNVALIYWTQTRPF